MSFPQFTTPTVTLTFSEEGLDLTEAENVYVTFRSAKVCITKTGDDLTVAAKEIGVKLSQEETGKLTPGYVQIQANWTDANGSRSASEIAAVDVSEQLLKRVVE